MRVVIVMTKEAELSLRRETTSTLGKVRAWCCDGVFAFFLLACNKSCFEFQREACVRDGQIVRETHKADFSMLLLHRLRNIITNQQKSMARLSTMYFLTAEIQHWQL